MNVLKLVSLVSLLSGSIAAAGCYTVPEQEVSRAFSSDVRVEPRLGAIVGRIFADVPGQASCNQCHGENAVAGLDLRPEHAWRSLLHGTSKFPGWRYVVPGEPDESLLYFSVSVGADCQDLIRSFEQRFLTAGFCRLPNAERAAIREWILRGAPND